MGKHPYSSTHVNVPEPLANQIRDWSARIAEPELFKNEEHTGRELAPHATILYGLYSTNPDSVKEYLQHAEPFEVTLGVVGAFKNCKFDVLKIEVESDGLQTLHEKLTENCGFYSNYPCYRPHVTLAYLRCGMTMPYEGDTMFEGMSFTVREVVFSGRNGTGSCIIPLGNFTDYCV
jgi:2'-5' RNA ligase